MNIGAVKGRDRKARGRSYQPVNIFAILHPAMKWREDSACGILFYLPPDSELPPFSSFEKYILHGCCDCSELSISPGFPNNKRKLPPIVVIIM